MRTYRFTRALAVLAVGLGSVACGGSTYRVHSRAPVASDGSAPSAGYGASRASAAQARGDQESLPTEARPGLGTAWGESRASYSSSAPFWRSSDDPIAVTSLWYNDREGAEQMARWGDYRSYDRYETPIAGSAVTVSVRDDSERPFPSFYAGGRHYVVGEPGQRYVLTIHNHTGYRFECVASVDGLDVIDGRAAAYGKRGYILDPYGTVAIEGFRQSEDTVAAFRFSSVRGSYSNRSGQGDSNVGVIGVALFSERGSYPSWTDDEVRRRHNADPFPQRYALPPP
jgi:hypothetical protein